LLRDMAMNPFQWIGSPKGEVTCEHFVKGHPEAVQIASRVDGAVDSPGLFWRQVGQGSFDEIGRLWRWMLAPNAGRDPEAHEPDLTGRGIRQHIGRLYIFVDEVLLMDAAQCVCQCDSKAQGLCHAHALT
jgi:hypothetical protein